MDEELVLLPGTVERLIARTLRVPAFEGAPGDAAALARQLDAALLSEGFVAPAALLAHLAGLDPGSAHDAALTVLAAVKQRIGDHVEHNPYFIDFPASVPATEEFWAQCLVAAGAELELTAPAIPVVDLVALPHYGRYQHSFAEMLARREPRLAQPDDRRTHLTLGGPVEDEARRAYVELATATTPLTRADLDLLADLAAAFAHEDPPTRPDENDDTGTEVVGTSLAENRAVLDSARLAAGRPLALAETVTDVLRVAVRASGGDVALAEPARLRSFTRRERRALLGALDRIVGNRPSSLHDVRARRERWKRLGERLHPHEHATRFPQATRVFAVARRDERPRSAIARAELAAARGNAAEAARELAVTPGVLLRWCDRLLRIARADDADRVLDEVAGAAGAVSGRVLCSLRAHLENADRPNTERLFVTRRGRPHLEPETRPPLPDDLVARLAAILDDEIARRLPAPGTLVVDPGILDVALPLSGKASAGGHAILPRGTTAPISPAADTLRFFVHWRQAARRTDFDLSVLLLDEAFTTVGQVSWTQLQGIGLVHSGDLVEAPEGATEFIDVTLTEISARYVVPQVNVYSGEGFDEVAESLFGYHTLEHPPWWHRRRQAPPFDPRTVRARSELRGSGRIALPLAFRRDDDGTWRAVWLHLLLTGRPAMNRVETNQVTTSSLVRDAVTRRVLTMRYLVDLMARRADGVVVLPDDPAGRVEGLDDVVGPITFVGLEPVTGLPEHAEAITLDRLATLIPS